MANKMSKWKKCKSCGAVMRLAVIHGIPCYKHQNQIQKRICTLRKAKAAAAKEYGENLVR